MWDWITNLFNDGSGGNAAAGSMMAGVPGFDPSDPGAYANRTAGDADMGGYGGSPRLPDSPTAKTNWGGLARAGAGLMAAGAPSGGGGLSWRPTQSPVGRGNPALAQQLTSVMHMPHFINTPPALGGLLSEGQPMDDPRRRRGGLLDIYG